MSYKGRVITFLCVFIINLIYASYYYLQDGHLSWIEPIGFPILLALAWWFGKQYDLSQYYSSMFLRQQKELEDSYRELQESRNELLSLFENSNAFFWTIDLVKQEITVSKGIEDMVGYSQDKFKQHFDFWMSLIHPDDLAITKEHYNKVLSGESSQSEIRIMTSSGTVKWIETQGKPVLDCRGKVIKLTGVFYDITERKLWEDQMKQLAHHDYLTGLPNRFLLNEYLQKYLAISNRNHTTLAVMFIDLDNFKMINDTSGHDIGDALLQQAGKRLTSQIRAGDVAARLGGDEFILLLNDVDHAQVKGIAERLTRSFSEPFLINDQVCTVSTSIGISLYPQDVQDGELLIQYADTAMYYAKKRGKNTFCFYNEVPKNKYVV